MAAYSEHGLLGRKEDALGRALIEVGQQVRAVEERLARLEAATADTRRQRGGNAGPTTRTPSPARHRCCASHAAARPAPECSFSGVTEDHPLVFLRKLDRYLTEYDVPEMEQLDVAMKCLTGNASEWGETERDLGTISSYTDFCRVLRQEYWTPARGELARVELHRTAWSPSTGLSMAEGLVSLARKAQFLDPPLPEEQLVHRLAQHFPDAVSTAFLRPGAQPRSVRALRAFLRDLEDSDEWRRTMEPERPLRAVQGVHALGVDADVDTDSSASDQDSESGFEEDTPAAPDPRRPRGRRKRQGCALGRIGSSSE